MNYSQVQGIAKETISYIKTIIKPGMNLVEIRKICEEKMLELGADSFWYWDIGAFVFAGDETTISVSGKEYITTSKIISYNDIITVDLSPQKDNIWGDFARTIIIEEGSVIEDINDINNKEWKNGILMEELLHKELERFVTVNTTFEELYIHINEFIKKNDYINLDFMGNLGHSIEKKKNNRVYIEKGNKMKLLEATMFTFEPHISMENSQYGYKKENIYLFRNNELTEL